MKYQQILRAFVASPGDAAAERSVLDGVAEELNDTWADFVGTRITLLDWASHTWPAVGSDAQAVINEQIGEDYELFVGVFRESLGTATPRALSGSVEEFERALDRYRATGIPEIMLYLRAHDESEQFSAFRRRVASEGVLYYRYDSLGHFEQALRIHMSRQIQRLARADRRPARLACMFPREADLDLAASVRSATAKVEVAGNGADQFVAIASQLAAQTSELSSAMATAAARLNRAKRPGFRRKPGAIASAIQGLTTDLSHYSSTLNQLLPDLINGYRTMVGSFGRALGILAPVAPLPSSLRGALSRVRPMIARTQEAVSSLRGSAESCRNVIYSWQRLAIPEFEAAKRSVLAALDSLDAELSGALHLTREVERATEQFLEG